MEAMLQLFRAQLLPKAMVEVILGRILIDNNKARAPRLCAVDLWK